LIGTGRAFDSIIGRTWRPVNGIIAMPHTDQNQHANTRQTLLPGRADVYTVLIVVAFLALLVGIGFVWYRSGALFDTGNPFTVLPQSIAGGFDALHR